LLEAFNIEHSISARHPPEPARFIPHRRTIGHVIGVYETFLQRTLGGDPVGNLQRSLLSQALYQHYEGQDLASMTPAQAPLIEAVCETCQGWEIPNGCDSSPEFAEEIGG
jgi:hypothetical protein